MKTLVCMQALALGIVLAAPAMADDTRVGTHRREHQRDVTVSTTHTTAAVTTPREDVVETRTVDRGDVVGDRWTIAPMLGAATNGLGLGVGARVGYTFRTPVYLGANYMYHTGSDDNGRTYAHYPSAELGYEV